MPNYLYRCAKCGELTQEKRTIETRNDAPDCPNCVLSMGREFSIPQLITQPVALQDANKFALGFDETTRRETRKADDKDYDRQWAGAETGVKNRSVKELFDKNPLAETFQKMG